MELAITSRYADEPDVTIDADRVPVEFRHLLPYAVQWAIGDDSERSQYAESISLEDKRVFLEAVRPHWDALNAFHEAHLEDTPALDEVVLFGMMAEAAAELDSEMGDE